MERNQQSNAQAAIAIDHKDMKKRLTRLRRIFSKISSSLKTAIIRPPHSADLVRRDARMNLDEAQQALPEVRELPLRHSLTVQYFLAKWPFKDPPPATKAASEIGIMERVLVHLPPEDVMRLRGICSGFKYIIDERSLAVRKMLFYDAEKSQELWISSDEEHSHVWNPMLRRIFWPFWELSLDRRHLLHWGFRKMREQLRVMNPEASWQNMLIAQPPLRTLRIWKISEEVENNLWSEQYAEAMWYAEEGIRMGLLFDIVEEHMMDQREDGIYDRPGAAFGAAFDANNSKEILLILFTSILYNYGSSTRAWASSVTSSNMPNITYRRLSPPRRPALTPLRPPMCPSYWDHWYFPVWRLRQSIKSARRNDLIDREVWE